MLRIRIDHQRCIGAGTCVFVAPTAFAWSETSPGKAVVADPTTVEEERLREAILACPTQAILIDERGSPGESPPGGRPPGGP